MDFTPVLNSLASFFPDSNFSKKSPYPLTVLVLSPHPDDESIMSALALRLLIENGAQVINVAVTLGSNKKRQAARKKELIAACRVLKFKNVVLSEDWRKKKEELKKLIREIKPEVIISPHSKDIHPAHIKTAELLKSVLPSFANRSFIIAWSEYWGQLQKPNLLLEVPREILTLQLKALEKHKGEVARNPFHLRLPGWMMDNVRRGSEIVGGMGSGASKMAFGVLYQIQLFKRKKFQAPKFSSSFFTHKEDIGHLFKLILDPASGSKTKMK